MAYLPDRAREGPAKLPILNARMYKTAHSRELGRGRRAFCLKAALSGANFTANVPLAKFQGVPSRGLL